MATLPADGGPPTWQRLCRSAVSCVESRASGGRAAGFKDGPRGAAGGAAVSLRAFFSV